MTGGISGGSTQGRQWRQRLGKEARRRQVEAPLENKWNPQESWEQAVHKKTEQEPSNEDGGLPEMTWPAMVSSYGRGHLVAQQEASNAWEEAEDKEKGRETNGWGKAELVAEFKATDGEAQQSASFESSSHLAQTTWDPLAQLLAAHVQPVQNPLKVPSRIYAQWRGSAPWLKVLYHLKGALCA